MKILVCYAGKGESEELFSIARKHADAFNAGIVLVTSIVEGSRELDQMKNKSQEVFDAEKMKCEEMNIRCETHILYHGISEQEQLLHFAKENNIDQVILGAKKRSKLGKLIMGSIIQHFILSMICPILTVPMDRN
jgi:nucleotide-binding universal stress UspA family protein